MSSTHREIKDLLTNPLKIAVDRIQQDKQLNHYLQLIHDYYLSPSKSFTTTVPPDLKDLARYEAQPDLIPRKDRWRLFIDGYRQNSSCTPLSFDPNDPGYHSGIFSAFQLMLQTLHLPLTTELIIALHDMAIKDTPRKEFKGITSDAIKYGFSYSSVIERRTITEKGLLALKEECEKPKPLLSIGKYNKHLRHIALPLNPEELSALTLDSFKDEDYARMDPRDLDDLSDEEKVAAKAERLEHILNQYQQALLEAKGNPDAILKAIAQLAQKGDLLHPFADANIRTYGMLLANRELLLHGFPPVMWENPNRLDGYSIEELVLEMKLGMENAKRYGFRALSLEEINQYCADLTQPPVVSLNILAAPPPSTGNMDHQTRPRSGTTPEAPPFTEPPTRPRSGTTPETPPFTEPPTRPRSGTTPEAPPPPSNTNNDNTFRR